MNDRGVLESRRVALTLFPPMYRTSPRGRILLGNVNLTARRSRWVRALGSRLRPS